MSGYASLVAKKDILLSSRCNSENSNIFGQMGRKVHLVFCSSATVTKYLKNKCQKVFPLWQDWVLSLSVWRDSTWQSSVALD